jgi:putative phosphoesterase
MKKIGVLSDTHGYLDPKVASIFQGVDHILHAGDIGLPWLILQLEEIAPVTAVTGNVDQGLDYKETEVLELDHRKFLIHHIVEGEKPTSPIHRRIVRENPDVVVYGHTHKRVCEHVNGTLYLNPGYAGKQRFRLPRSVAVLHSDTDGITVEFEEL